MKVPDWWDAALLAFASFRTWRLLAKDVVLEGLRNRIVRLGDWEEGYMVPEGFRSGLAEFIGCPWCFGFWITLAWWGAWQALPHATLVAAGLGLLLTAVGLIAKLDQDD